MFSLDSEEAWAQAVKLGVELLENNAQLQPEESIQRAWDFTVDWILVQPGNVLEFILEDGNVITRTWKAYSRRESWTPEKREQARQKMMRYHSERRACANE